MNKEVQEARLTPGVFGALVALLCVGVAFGSAAFYFQYVRPKTTNSITDVKTPESFTGDFRVSDTYLADPTTDKYTVYGDMIVSGDLEVRGNLEVTGTLKFNPNNSCSQPKTACLGGLVHVLFGDTWYQVSKRCP